jgi:hypothetical protein
VFADLVGLFDHAVMVARHARQSIFGRPIRPARVADDGRRSLVDALARRVDQEVALEPVGQVEYDLAAVRPECLRGVAGAERMGEARLVVDAIRRQRKRASRCFPLHDERLKTV